MQYSFDVEDAEKYGLSEAVFLHNIKFWVLNNRANGRNCHPVNPIEYPELTGQTRTFTFNSITAFKKLFPFWTDRQIRLVIETLEKAGVLIWGSYNEDRRDRTKWYALRDESILQKSKLHLTEKANPSDENGEPLPDSKPDSKFDIAATLPPIELSQEDKVFNSLQLWIEENAKRVNQLKEPMTKEQLSKLLKSYDKDKIKDILEKMHNRATLLKDYISAYKTAKNWLSRDAKNTTPVGTSLFNQQRTAPPLTVIK